jgi:hypothetical protein
MSVVSNHQAESIREQVVRAGAHMSASQYRLIHLVVQLDESGEWAADGSPTCAHWLADALDVDTSTAREWLRVGKKLTELSMVDSMFEQGRLTYSKVRAVTRVAKPETQGELCELAESVPARWFTIALAKWQEQRETPEETVARQEALRTLSWRIDADGMIAGSFRLPPVVGGALTTGVDAMVRSYPPGASADASSSGIPKWPSLRQQRADALVALVKRGGLNVATEIVMHVRGDGCTLDDGTPIAGSLVERIAPQAYLRALIHDAESRPINASGRHRHPTARQRRVVHERDRGCVDCGSTALLDYDHVPPFEVTQRTVVDELQTRCVMCHHARHQRGPTVTLPAHESTPDA